MGGIRISAAPDAVVEADHRRFGDYEVETVIQRSGLVDLKPDVLRRYCHWFLGKGYGWKVSWSGGDPRQGYGTGQLLTALADHLGLVPDERLRKAADGMDWAIGRFRAALADIDATTSTSPRTSTLRWSGLLRSRSAAGFDMASWTR
jgi:hypothetical protein